MRTHQPTRKARAIAVSASALAGMSLLLTACDRQQERLDRSQELIGATVEQLSGGDPIASSMEQASIDERAIAGRMMDASEVFTVQRQARYAVGSIVAKPRQISYDTPEAYEALQGTPSDDSAAADTNESLLPPPRDLKRATRRAVMSPRSEPRLDVGRMKMEEACDKFGLEANIGTSKGGQLIMQIDTNIADPTQFRGPEVTPVRPQLPGLPRLPNVELERADLECPDNAGERTVRGNPQLALNCVIKELRDSGEYEYVEKDFIFEHQFALRPRGSFGLAARPNDPLWDLQWHFQDPGSGANRSDGGAGFQSFWTKAAQQGSRDVVVAVIDTGLALDHPDIAGSPNVAQGWDMVSDLTMANDGDGRDNNPNDPGDQCDLNDPNASDSFHGTHVAGTVGAAVTNNQSGVAGGAWNVTVVPVRALGRCGGRLSDINDAIRWAAGVIPAQGEGDSEIWNENPADIINLSIGLFGPCPASMQDAINSVVERGAVVVAAAGNAQISTQFYAPGGCQNVISVAAGDARGHIAPYSNYGFEVDVLAPGGDLSRDDNGDGRPDGVLSTRPASNCVDPVSGDPVDSCHYAYEHGTSMAAPHVSAGLALLKAGAPELTGPELTEKLLSALRPRSLEQCASPCDQYPGAEEIESLPGMCMRPCGGGLLDLTGLADDAE